MPKDDMDGLRFELRFELAEGEEERFVEQHMAERHGVEFKKTKGRYVSIRPEEKWAHCSLSKD